MDKFYKNLNLKDIKNKDKNLLEKSIKNLFNCQIVSLFNSNYLLFDIVNLDQKRFNNIYQLIKLIKKKKNQKIHINGHIYKGLIKYKKKYVFKKIFCKECPCFNPLYLNIGCNSNNDPYNDFILHDFKYNLNSSVNIEIFISYLLSRIVEHKISPHFSIFYGSANTTMKKYTSEISEEELLKLDSKNTEKITIYTNKYNENFLERYNFPVNIIFSEKLDSDLYNYSNSKINITETEWASYIFQIISALVICQKYFSLYHNDLHLSNIMYSHTDVVFLYYCHNNVYFKIPTYSKIIKIIDWGRATYDFNNIKGNNYIFRKDGDAFGQYYYNKFNRNGKKPILPNPSIDLALLGCNLTIEKTFPKKGKLFNLIKSWITIKKNKMINKKYIEQNSFEFYIQVSHNLNKSVPHKQIIKPPFKQFIIKKELIPNNTIIYQI